MKTKWNCPNCQMSSTRHWNVERHIQRQHGGMDEPVRYDTMQYYKDTNPENFRFPFAYSHHPSSASLTPKEKSDKNFSEFLEHQILQPLRRMIEFKNLFNQLLTIQPQPQRIMQSGGGGVYSNMPSRTFENGEFNNNLSEHSIFEEDDYSEIIGYRGHVCEKCLVIYIATIFRHNDRQSGQTERKHTCDSKRLDDAQLEPNKDKTITDMYEKLREIMKEKVNSWTKKSAYIVAIDLSSNAELNNSFEITPTHENHWAARATKNKQTILNDEEIQDFLCKAGNATCAYFKVISAYQQQQGESLPRYYLMMITNSKIKNSFAPLLQNT
ncbi:MAG TPA: hypothetical protein VE818_04005 [Nitrososphaeraceae archaeon]|nr:hypothetical protein [Nitrososphaeraceae archaeon]